jgi:hypothetical protein
MYSSGNAKAPYFYLCPVPLYNIFPHYLKIGTIFGKKLLNTKCVFRITCTNTAVFWFGQTEEEINKN